MVQKTTSTRSQTQAIYAWLKRGKSLTPISALSKFGCMRLGARIHDLKKCGIQIATKMIQRNGKRYASYSLT